MESLIIKLPKRWLASPMRWWRVMEWWWALMAIADGIDDTWSEWWPRGWGKVRQCEVCEDYGNSNSEPLQNASRLVAVPWLVVVLLGYACWWFNILNFETKSNFKLERRKKNCRCTDSIMKKNRLGCTSISLSTSTSNTPNSIGKFVKPEPFTIWVTDVLQWKYVEGCLDIPVTEQVNAIWVSILSVSYCISYSKFMILTASSWPEDPSVIRKIRCLLILLKVSLFLL